MRQPDEALAKPQPGSMDDPLAGTLCAAQNSIRIGIKHKVGTQLINIGWAVDARHHVLHRGQTPHSLCEVPGGNACATHTCARTHMCARARPQDMVEMLKLGGWSEADATATANVP